MPFPSESDGTHDPAFDPLIEAGEGEAEGFELAEQELIKHASHGDEHGTGIIAQHAGDLDEEDAGAVYGEADDAEWDDFDEDELPVGDDDAEPDDLDDWGDEDDADEDDE